LNNNKLINPKLICAFCWFILSSIKKMHGPKNKNKKTVYSCQILTKFEFSREVCEKSSSMKFQENPSGGSRFVA